MKSQVTSLRTVAVSQLVSERSKLSLTALGITLAVLFLTGIFIVNQSTTAALEEDATSLYKNSDYVAQAPGSFYGDTDKGEDFLSEQVLRDIADSPVVKSSWPLYKREESLQLVENKTAIMTRSNFPEDTSIFPWSIDGRAPTASNEVLISSQTAEEYGLKVGNHFPMTDLALNSETGEVKDSERTIVGIFQVKQPNSSAARSVFEGGSALQKNLDDLTLDSAGSRNVSGARQVLLELQDPHDKSAEVLNSLWANIESQQRPVLSSVEAQIQQAVRNQSQGVNVQLYVLLVFGGLALLMSAFVIANTFHALVAQRVPQLALLRTLGASSTTVFWLLMLESLILGAVFSAVGVSLAYVLAFSLSKVFQDFTIDFSTSAGLIGFLVGVSMTLLANLLPTWKVFKISPLAMFTSVSARGSERAISPRVALLGLLLSILGTGLFVGGNTSDQTLLILAGCFSLMLGWVLLFPLILRWIIQTFRWGASPFSNRALASQNAVHSATRTAATGRMIFLSTVLIGAVLMGYSSMKTTIFTALDEWSPVSLTATMSPDRTTPSLTYSSVSKEVQNLSQKVNQLENLPTVESAQVVSPAGTLLLDSPAQPGFLPVVYAADWTQLQQTVPVVSELLQDTHTIVINKDFAEANNVHDGEKISVQGTESNADFTVRFTSANIPFPLISSKTQQELGQPTQELFSKNNVYPTVFFKTTPGAGFSAIQEDMNVIAQTLGIPFQALSGGALERNSMEENLNKVLMACFILLAATILISCAGVANSTTLSTIQRSQDNALFRTIGMPSQRLQQLISAEILMISLVAAVLGSLVGVSICAMGLQILAVEDLAVKYSFPWIELLAMICTAILLSWLAALTPAQQAAKISPIEALQHTR